VLHPGRPGERCLAGSGVRGDRQILSNACEMRYEALAAEARSIGKTKREEDVAKKTLKGIGTLAAMLF